MAMKLGLSKRKVFQKNVVRRIVGPMNVTGGERKIPY
jgi:hypothetical protein